MFSDDALNKLIEPVVARQEEANLFVIETIADRVRNIGLLSLVDLRKLEQLYISGMDIKKINAHLAEVAELQVKDIKSIIRTVAEENYIDAKPFYDYRHKKFVPLNNNKELMKVVNEVGNEMVDTYKNISDSRATGFLIRDSKNPNSLKFQSIGDTYKSVVDEAIRAVQHKEMDFNTAVRRTIRQLAESGVRRLYWESGYTQRLDTAVRRNIQDGVHRINQEMQDVIGKQIHADGVELSAHINSAPDHEPIQGHVFTNKEYDKLQNVSAFKDVEGNRFSAIERAIGMWNCRHYAISVIVDAHKPKYTTAQLQAMIEKNHKGYTTADGRHLTMYECTQVQRQLETKIRNAKEGQIAFRASGDKLEARKYQTRINRYSAQYKAFSNACGLSQQIIRTRVYGYHKIKADN